MNVTLTDLIQILIAITAIAALFYQIGKRQMTQKEITAQASKTERLLPI